MKQVLKLNIGDVFTKEKSDILMKWVETFQEQTRKKAIEEFLREMPKKMSENMTEYTHVEDYMFMVGFNDCLRDIKSLALSKYGIKIK